MSSGREHNSSLTEILTFPLTALGQPVSKKLQNWEMSKHMQWSEELVWMIVKRGIFIMKLKFFLEKNRTKLDVLSLHCSTLNVYSYWIFDVPDQLSWRKRRHPRKNSAVEKLSQTMFVALEGHRWWLKYELPSSNTSGTCGYRQRFVIHCRFALQIEAKYIHAWVGHFSDAFQSKNLQHFLWTVIILVDTVM